MPRFISHSVRIALDLLVLTSAMWLAFLCRFEFQLAPVALHVALVNWPIVVFAHYAGLVAFGVPRMSWRYMTMRDAVRIVTAVMIPATFLVLIRLVLAHFAAVPLMPLGVLAMNPVLTFVGLVGARAAWRLRNEVQDRKKRAAEGVRHRVLLIGAGEAGVQVAREIANRPDLGLHVVGFLDDNSLKIGATIAGLRVLGTTAMVAEVAERKRIKRALITIANASGKEIRRLSELCRSAGLDTKIVPGLYEIVGEKLSVSRFREIAIEDLLRREPVQLDEQIVSGTIRSRVVLVTGAGGSIGAELCRQVCRFGPERLVLVERFENALFDVHRELASRFPHVPIEPRVADVCDRERMEQIFEASKPTLVFHAAAHKHVPMMEWNPGEGVKNNIGGTRTVADLADRYGVERLVLVSTDKAVNPSSVMGATKRVAEIYVQALSQRSSTRFVTVRFGNVLGSAGSVIPIFREQIARGGPVTVTHPDMTRYFMTIPEATQLVLQAGAMGDGGEIFILDMGEPVRIVDLAHDLIELSGLKANDDIEIRFSGIRPGEKLVEELSTDSEHADKTRHPKVFIGRIKPHEWDSVHEGVENVMSAARSGDADRIRTALGLIVPEFSAVWSVPAGAREKELSETN